MSQGGAVAGFVLAAFTCGDRSGARAKAALAPALKLEIEAALAEVAAESPDGRRRFFAAASRALDPGLPGGARANLEPHARGLARALRRLAEADPSAAELALVHDLSGADSAETP
jgi:hypothetical protein